MNLDADTDGAGERLDRYFAGEEAVDDLEDELERGGWSGRRRRGLGEGEVVDLTGGRAAVKPMRQSCLRGHRGRG